MPIRKGRKNRQKFPDNIKSELNKRKSCEECNRRLKLTSPERMIHHKIKVIDGGTDTLDNLQILCIECHYNKHGKVELGMELWEYRTMIYRQYKDTNIYYKLCQKGIIKKLPKKKLYVGGFDDKS